MLASKLGRRLERALDRPSGGESPVQRLHPETKASRPVFQRQRLAVECQLSRYAHVPILLCASRPSNIAWRVRTVVVDALEGMVRCRAWPHVEQKKLERIAPPVADRDATAAVSRVSSRLRIQTARLHSAPAGVFGRESMAAGQAVRGISRCAQFPCEATAGPRRRDVCVPYEAFVAAIAATAVRRAAGRQYRLARNHESASALADIQRFVNVGHPFYVAARPSLFKAGAA